MTANTPANMTGELDLAVSISSVVFLIVYVQLGIEMLAAFFPGLRLGRRKIRVFGVTIEVGSGNNENVTRISEDSVDDI